MKAVLMAGGFGKRLHPLTSNIPKPLVPICGKPIMSYVISHLKKHGITDIIVLLYHQPNLIKKEFGDGKDLGVSLTYVAADKDYGTAGAVKYASKYLDGPFLVISADLVTDIDLGEVIRFHDSKKALATITLTRVQNPLEYGIVITEDSGRIKHFLEKPSWAQVFSDTINTGIYVIDDQVLSQIPEEKFFDFSRDLFPAMLEKKQSLFGCVAQGYWKDVGNLVEYRQAHRDALEKKILLCDARVDPGAKISSNAVIKGSVRIGEKTFVSDEAYVANSSIGSGCSVGRGARIANSVIWDNVYIGKGSDLDGAIVAGGSKLMERVRLEEGSVVAEDCIVEADSSVRSYVKIWPSKIVEEGSIVNSSMIWRQRWSKTIFGQYGVTGICNVELTPEFAAKLGSAFGAMLGKGSSVTSSMDGHKASRMLSRGLISGLLSAGVNVSNLETVPSPINRFELKALRSKGGIHVRKSPFDPNIIDIKFFDANGMDLPPAKEKAIERLFWGEDYERPTIDETGELTFPFYRVAEGYKEALLSFIKADAVRTKSFKIVIDYSYGSSSSIFPSILGELGCEAVAINAYIDESRFTKTKDDFDRSLKTLSQIVVTLKADLGIMFDAGAEKIFLVDEKGRVLDGYSALALFSLLVSKFGKAKAIGVPVTASSVVDDIAKQNKVSVVRTATTVHSMMETAASSGVAFFGEELGGYIFPDFQASFDAMVSCARLLDLLAAAGIPVSEMVDSISKKTVLKRVVPCPHALKGAVIRSILDGSKGGKVELLDGVKAHFGRDWVLVTGHPDKQEILIYSESEDPEKAKDLAESYKDKVKKIISSQLGK